MAAPSEPANKAGMEEIKLPSVISLHKNADIALMCKYPNGYGSDSQTEFSVIEVRAMKEVLRMNFSVLSVMLDPNLPFKEATELSAKSKSTLEGSGGKDNALPRVQLQEDNYNHALALVTILRFSHWTEEDEITALLVQQPDMFCFVAKAADKYGASPFASKAFSGCFYSASSVAFHTIATWISAANGDDLIEIACAAQCLYGRDVFALAVSRLLLSSEDIWQCGLESSKAMWHRGENLRELLKISRIQLTSSLAGIVNRALYPYSQFPPSETADLHPPARCHLDESSRSSSKSGQLTDIHKEYRLCQTKRLRLASTLQFNLLKLTLRKKCGEALSEPDSTTTASFKDCVLSFVDAVEQFMGWKVRFTYSHHKECAASLYAEIGVLKDLVDKDFQQQVEDIYLRVIANY